MEKIDMIEFGKMSEALMAIINSIIDTIKALINGFKQDYKNPYVPETDAE